VGVSEEYLRRVCYPFGIKRGWYVIMNLQLFSFYIVVILSVRGPLVREFLLAAHALGMTRGDWAFLDVEIFQVMSDFYKSRYLC
jgi:hypothetical protein